MAFSPGDRVQVADFSVHADQAFRQGTVQRVEDDDYYAVRLDGHGCRSTMLFHEDQLRAELRASDINYSFCSG